MRVLVVEDDARTADMLRRGLAEDGYIVDVTDDGDEALWRADEIDYDVIVLDLMLPSTDGLELCRQLRSRGEWAGILILSARNGIRARVQGLDAGADDFLPKPFAFAELTARLRAIARRGMPERPSVLTSGDLALDPAGRRAWRGTVELQLSDKEFTLLELFLRRPEEVLSRSVLREHAWDFASEATSNVVDQYVASLRRKIDRPFGVVQLETVRGTGYRLRRIPLAATTPAGMTEPAGTSAP